MSIKLTIDQILAKQSDHEIDCVLEWVLNLFFLKLTETKTNQKLKTSKRYILCTNMYRSTFFLFLITLATIFLISKRLFCKFR